MWFFSNNLKSWVFNYCCFKVIILICSLIIFWGFNFVELCLHLALESKWNICDVRWEPRSNNEGIMRYIMNDWSHPTLNTGLCFNSMLAASSHQGRLIGLPYNITWLWHIAEMPVTQKNPAIFIQPFSAFHPRRVALKICFENLLPTFDKSKNQFYPFLLKHHRLSSNLHDTIPLSIS